MPEFAEIIALAEANWPIVAAVLALALVLAAWLFSRRNARNRTRHRAPDALDDGAAPAARNQALIDAPSAVTAARLADSGPDIMAGIGAPIAAAAAAATPVLVPPPPPVLRKPAKPPRPARAPVAIVITPPPEPIPEPSPKPKPAPKPALKPKAVPKPKAAAEPKSQAKAKTKVAPAAKPKPAAVPKPLPTPAPAPAPPPPAPPPASPPVTPPPAPPVAAPTVIVPVAAAVLETSELARIKGLGPKLQTLLPTLGVTTLAQIAAWDDAEIDRIDAQLGVFAGRIRKDSWVEQAKFLSAGDVAGFEDRFGKV